MKKQTLENTPKEILNKVRQIDDIPDNVAGILDKYKWFVENLQARDMINKLNAVTFC